MKKFLFLLCLALLITTAGCNNSDPAVSNSESDSETSSDIAPEENGEIPEYIDADALANRSYELRYLFAQKKFESPEEISVNVLVQFAFCHMYYENLADMPTSGNKIRRATADEIKTQIQKYFGALDVDITTADLYNKGKERFEMWEPNYGSDIYYDVKVTSEGDNLYKAVTTFYTDSLKSEATFRTALTVEDAGGQIMIRKLSSSNQG